MKKCCSVLFAIIFILGSCASIFANAILIPMDKAQKNHLKSYGLAFHVLQRERRIFEDRPDLGAELGAWVLIAALETALVGKPQGVLPAAVGAGHDAIRPAGLDQIGVSTAFVGKELDGGLQGGWRVQAFHARNHTEAGLVSQLYYYRFTWNELTRECCVLGA